MKCWWVYLLLISTTANSQIVYDAYSMSLASSDLSSTQRFYLGRNPATIVDQNQNYIGCSQLMPFGISSFGTNSFVLAGKIKKQGFAIDYAQSGLNDYKEHIISITTGLRLSKKLSLGIKIVNLNIDIEDLPILSKYKIEIGMIENFGNKLSVGIYLKQRIHKQVNENEHTSLNVGWSYLLDSKFSWFFSSEINELGLFSIRSGLEYRLKSNITARIGWSNKETSLATGIAYRFQRLLLETSSSYHHNLGLSYGVGLCYNLSKEMD